MENSYILGHDFTHQNGTPPPVTCLLKLPPPPGSIQCLCITSSPPFVSLISYPFSAGSFSVCILQPEVQAVATSYMHGIFIRKSLIKFCRLKLLKFKNNFKIMQRSSFITAWNCCVFGYDAAFRLTFTLSIQCSVPLFLCLAMNTSTWI